MAIRTVIFDLDGTLFRGTTALPGAAEAVRWLLGRGVQVRYLTNNSGHTIEHLREKLTGMGFPAQPEEIMSSGLGAARRLRQDGIQSAFVVGEPGLHETFRQNGIATEGESQAVVVGICRSFTYDLLNEAMQRIRSGQPFYATNRDATYPLEGGRFIPGAGSIVASVETASGVVPTVIGKPEPTLVLEILKDSGTSPEEALCVGDRIDTDLLSAQAAECRGLLVLTGVASAEDPRWPSLSSVADLPNHWERLGFA